MIARYAGAVVGIALGGAAVLAAASGRIGPAAARGAVLGTLLAAACAVGGMALLLWSFEKGPRPFFGALVGGILGRLLIFGAALVYVALRLAEEYSLPAAAASLLGAYVVFQVVEVRFVVKGLRGRRP